MFWFNVSSVVLSSLNSVPQSANRAGKSTDFLRKIHRTLSLEYCQNIRKTVRDQKKNRMSPCRNWTNFTATGMGSISYKTLNKNRCDCKKKRKKRHTVTFRQVLKKTTWFEETSSKTPPCVIQSKNIRNVPHKERKWLEVQVWKFYFSKFIPSLESLSVVT